MELAYPFKSFKAAFDVAARVVPTRTPKAVLQSVLLAASEDALAFIATDLELSIRHVLPTASPVMPGVVLLPREQVSRLLSSADGETIRLSLDGRQLTIRCGSAKWTVPTEDPDLFPAVPSFAPPAYHTLASADFKRLVKRTIYAVDPASQHYALGGMLVDATATRFALVATSGRSLARQEVEASYTGEWAGDAQRQYVIPARAAKEIAAIVPDEGTIDLGFPDANTVHVRWGDTLVVSRLTEGRFPRWQEMMSARVSRKVPVESGPFRQAVQQASAMTTDTSRAVDFDFGSDGLRLSSTSADRGHAEVEFPLAWAGSALPISIDPAYLLDMLRSFGDGVESATLDLDSPKEPFQVATEDGFAGAIATMTREAR